MHTTVANESMATFTKVFVSDEGRGENAGDGACESWGSHHRPLHPIGDLLGRVFHARNFSGQARVHWRFS